MFNFRKISLFILAIVILIGLGFWLFISQNRTAIEKRIISELADELSRADMELFVEASELSFVPPRFIFYDVKIVRGDSREVVLEAEKLSVSLDPIKLIVASHIPLKITVDGYVLNLNLSWFDGAGTIEGRRSLRLPVDVPTIDLSRGRIRFKDDEGSVSGAFSIPRLRVRKKAFQEKAVRIDLQGKEWTLKFSGRSFQGDRFVLGASVYPEVISVERVFVSSRVITLRGRGAYSLASGDIKGVASGKLDLGKLAEMIGSGAGRILRAGRADYKVRLFTENGNLGVEVDSDIGNLSLVDWKCEGGLSCLVKEGVLEVKKFSLKTPAGEITGGGGIRLSSLEGSANLSISGLDFEKISTLFRGLGPVSIRGIGNGAVSLTFEGAGRIGVSGDVTADEGFQMTLGGGNRLVFKNPIKLSASYLLEIAMGRLRLSDIDLSISEEENEISMEGWVDFTDMTAEYEASIEFPNMEGVEISGIFAKARSVKGEIRGTGDIRDPSLKLNLSLAGLSILGSPGGELKIKGEGVFSRSMSVALDFTSVAGDVTATGTYFPDRDIFVGSGVARNLDVSVVRKALASEGSPLMEVSVSLDRYLPFKGYADFSGDMTAGKGLMEASGKLKLRELVSPTYSVDAAECEIQFKEGEFRLRNLKAELFGGRISGRGLASGDKVYGEIVVSDIDISSVFEKFHGASDFPVSGNFSGGAVFEVHGSELAVIEGNFFADDFKLARFPVGDLRGDITYRNGTVHLQFSSAGGVEARAEYDIGRGWVGTEFEFKEFGFPVYRLFAREGVFPQKLYLSGEVDAGFPVSVANYSQLLREGRLSVDLKLDEPDGSTLSEPLRVVGSLNEGRGEIKVSRRENIELLLKPRITTSYVLLQVSGNVQSGKINFKFPSGLDGSARLDLRIRGGVRFVGNEFIPEGVVEVTGGEIEYLRKKLQIEGASLTFSSREVSVERAAFATEDSRFEVKGRFEYGGRFDFALSGGVDASLVRTIVRGVFEELDGVVDSKIRVVGKYPEIQLGGEGIFRDGYVKFVGFKHPLENVNARLSLSGDKIGFESIECLFGGGKLTGDGEVIIVRGGPVNINFDTKFSDVSFAYPEEFPSVLKGRVEVAGPVTDLFIRGDVVVQRARYTRSIYPEELLISLKRKIKKYETVGEGGFSIKLDIDCVSDGTIEIHNNLGDLTARGDFKILGDTRKVIIMGVFEVLEGEIRYRGSEYEIERLVVDFHNPVRNNPTIDALAVTQKNEYTIYVEVTGTLEKYQVDFYSEPPLSKNDIVSLLSVGVTSEVFAQVEGGAATAGLASVALSPLRSKIEEKIGRFAGLERFTVEANYSQVTGIVEPTIVIGKNFGDRLSVDFSTPLGGTGRSSVAGEVKLSSDFYLYLDWLSSSTESTGEVGGELRFKRHFPSFREFIRTIIGGDGW